MRPLVLAIATASLACTMSTVAHATPPDDVELAVRTGLITRPAGNDGSPVALGFGARLGGMISSFYFGLSVINYWGGSQASGPPPGGSGIGSAPGAATSTGVVGAEYLLYGLDLGYSFTLFNRLIVRPQLGGGLAKTTDTCTTTGAGGSGSALSCGGPATYGPYLEPGVTGLVPLGQVLFAGVDANLLLLIGGGTVSPALTIHAQLGLRF